MAPDTKIGSRPSGGGSEASEEAPAKGGKKKLIIIGAGVAVVAVAGYWFLAGPGKAASAVDPSASPTVSAEPSYKLGDVVVVDSISINLDGGHYLRLGLGLQLVAGAGGEGGTFNTAKALDAAIALFSGQTTESLSDEATREELKQQLVEKLKELYDEEVVDVYYTDFVTQ